MKNDGKKILTLYLCLHTSNGKKDQTFPKIWIIFSSLFASNCTTMALSTILWIKMWIHSHRVRPYDMPFKIDTKTHIWVFIYINFIAQRITDSRKIERQCRGYGAVNASSIKDAVGVHSFIHLFISHSSFHHFSLCVCVSLLYWPYTLNSHEFTRMSSIWMF